jgi:hypothetical protein
MYLIQGVLQKRHTVNQYPSLPKVAASSSTRSSKLAINNCENKQNQHCDDGNRNNPVRRRPVIRVLR